MYDTKPGSGVDPRNIAQRIMDVSNRLPPLAKPQTQPFMLLSDRLSFEVHFEDVYAMIQHELNPSKISELCSACHERARSALELLECNENMANWG